MDFPKQTARFDRFLRAPVPNPADVLVVVATVAELQALGLDISRLRFGVAQPLVQQPLVHGEAVVQRKAQGVSEPRAPYAVPVSLVVAGPDGSVVISDLSHSALHRVAQTLDEEARAHRHIGAIDFSVVTTREFAVRAKTYPKRVHVREDEGEISSFMPPKAQRGRVYPSCQFNPGLRVEENRRVIHQARAIGMPGAVLWAALQRKPPAFGGHTAVHVLLGACRGMRPSVCSMSIPQTL